MTETLSDAHHPAPHRHRIPRWMMMLALFGGPAAWFVQLTTSYALGSQPCFEGGMIADHSRFAPYAISFAVYVLCLAIALASGAAASAMLMQVGSEVGGDSEALLEVGGGRTRFFAKCGQFLGFGFALTILVSIIGLLVVPLCAA